MAYVPIQFAILLCYFHMRPGGHIPVRGSGGHVWQLHNDTRTLAGRLRCVGCKGYVGLRGLVVLCFMF